VKPSQKRTMTGGRIYIYIYIYTIYTILYHSLSAGRVYDTKTRRFEYWTRPRGLTHLFNTLVMCTAVYIEFKMITRYENDRTLNDKKIAKNCDNGFRVTYSCYLLYSIYTLHIENYYYRHVDCNSVVSYCYRTQRYLNVFINIRRDQHEINGNGTDFCGWYLLNILHIAIYYIRPVNESISCFSF